MTVSGPGGPLSSPPGSPAPGPDHPVPDPPAGPGVAPPFAAPPTEGRITRMWVGIGVAALAVLLCCGGGGTALVGLVVAGTQAINEQADAVVSDYFDAVQAQRYDQAYDLLCQDIQERESPSQFRRRVAAEPEISSYRVGDAVVTNGISVPVDVTYAGGDSDRLRVVLVQDTGTGELQVCGIN